MNENVIYIIAGIILLLIFWGLRRNANNKKHEELRKIEQAKRQSERKVSLADLKIKKQVKDEELSVEKI